MSIRNIISWPLHYSLIKKFGRAFKGNPLSNKNCLVPILANNAYEIYHTLCLNWRRISFNNSNAAQLRARAIKKGLLSETFLRTGGQPSTPHPKTETRELCIFKDGKSKLDIFFLLHLCHLPSVTGFGYAKICAGGDIVVPYHVTIRFSSNEKLHSAHITCNFSWCIFSTERELKLSQSAGLAISAERELDGIMQRLPRQLRRRRPQLTIDSGFFAGERTAAIERRALEPNPTPQGQLSPQQPASRVAACRAPYVFGGGPGVRRRSATNRLRAAVPTPSPAIFCAAPMLESAPGKPPTTAERDNKAQTIGLLAKVWRKAYRKAFLKTNFKPYTHMSHHLEACQQRVQYNLTKYGGQAQEHYGKVAKHIVRRMTNLQLGVRKRNGAFVKSYVQQTVEQLCWRKYLNQQIPVQPTDYARAKPKCKLDESEDFTTGPVGAIGKVGGWGGHHTPMSMSA